MIELSNLEFHYPGSDFKLAIEQLSIARGQKVAVIGPSGSGKTTLLNLIAGILEPNSGDVKVGDRHIVSLSDKEKRDYRIKDIGFVFQDFRLISYLNGLDNILLPFKINNSIKVNGETEDWIKLMCDEMAIKSKLSKFPNQLSHGEKQRLAICRALVAKPSIILADEPTGNLDPANKTNIMQLLFSYASKNDSTLITVTHDYDMLKGFDTVIDFNDLTSKKA
ncbi:ABC transporter ATP-binding protein [Carboxylicivirga sp. M1479]|uniref:ABC transporter ATP-binding protein n=1 Tax=Carboxylicivirga sp. M1479 TaxID=2594476 RepID=UPI0011776AC5|nr:ABC transporter ATP-binding protein [Carboxylicivirga sp. M1479]TRX70246.1 ABC transporter ATP-binding protein [Carboxylicivirga sp. M1479]